MNKVTLFFNDATGPNGVSESWYSSLSGTALTTQISNYLQARMGLAHPKFTFQYARVSNVPFNRKVTWRTPADTGNAVGTWSTSSYPYPFNALLFRMIMSDGSSGNKIFLHGFPGAMFNGRDYTPSGAFKTAVNFFGAMLVGQNIAFHSVAPHTLADRSRIASFIQESPRGAQLTPAVADLHVSVGQTVVISEQGNRIVGLDGKKVVTDVGAGGSTFKIGGATPIGNPLELGTGAYYVIDVDQYLQPINGEVEAVTSHRVGRPFGVFHGRRSATVPLRQ